MTARACRAADKLARRAREHIYLSISLRRREKWRCGGEHAWLGSNQVASARHVHTQLESPLVRPRCAGAGGETGRQRDVEAVHGSVVVENDDAVRPIGPQVYLFPWQMVEADDQLVFVHGDFRKVLVKSAGSAPLLERDTSWR